MRSIRKSLWINASADVVWALIADVGGVAAWFPSIKSSRLEGSVRICELDRGGEITEDVVLVDNDLRRLKYRILAGMAVTTHLATIDVIDGEDGRALVVYGTEVEPDVFANPIGRSIEVGLANLARVIASEK